MTDKFEQQGGFGETYLIPVIATFSLCLYLLLPSMKALIANIDMLLAAGLCLMAVAGSIWLSIQCFGDFMNFGIVVIFAITWTLAGSFLLDSVLMSELKLFDNRDVLSISALSIYIYLHAIILSVANVMEKRRDAPKQG
ncbi:MAG: hypothetical protein GKR93_02475 [Gammaproteobacteria bacterium]|nr:hypothetical protein [Gammaproteobacteria bacterium]